METLHRPLLIEALARIAAAHPYERKLVVARTPGEGRELLRALTSSGTPWLGFEVTTTWQLAQRLVGPRLAAEGITVIDAFDHAAILDEAIDAVLAGGGRLATLAEGTGLRRSIAAAVKGLRQSGIDAAALGRTRFDDDDKRLQLSRIMVAYERALEQRRVTDAAGVFRFAVASLLASSAMRDAGLDESHVFVLPGVSTRGLAGQLVRVMLERGAQQLPTDPVHGLRRPESVSGDASGVEPSAGISPLSWLHDVGACPESANVAVQIELFTATSVHAELREVLRRAQRDGLRWDEIEIVTTDPLAYGVAFDNIAQTLNIPVTYAVGLPVARTRPGRTVARYLEWTRTGLAAEVMREMLERGDIAVPADAGVSGPALARRLRRMRIGRGAARYRSALAAADASVSTATLVDIDAASQEVADAQARERALIAALRDILEPLLDVVPDETGGLVDVRAIASGALLLLRRAPRHSAADATSYARLSQRLQRIVATAARPVPLDAALAVVEESLDTRVPFPDSDGGAPWGSAGGHVYLSDLDHGGYTGRRATFVTGLDALRFPGGGSPDALLVDEDRHRLAEDTEGSRLPDAAERAEEKRYRLAMLLARLRGHVHLSYSMWDAAEGRALPPSAELLQAYRLISQDVNADYDALHQALAPAASPVPRPAQFDSTDVWMHALAGDDAAADGLPLVLAAFPGLAQGLTAGRALKSGATSAWIGVVRPRHHFDPRAVGATVSPTQLQTLGTCPHRYLMRYVMKLRRPDDPELLADGWLPMRERGSMLHRVFDQTLRSFDDERALIATAALEARAQSMLESELAAARERMPPPGEAVAAAESAGLREDVRTWCAMVREDGGSWVATEMPFGRGDAGEVEIDLPKGALRVRGSIDRVDRNPDGSLRVIDYKTGSSVRFDAPNRDYDGGRRLQHVVYAAAAAKLLGERVDEAEFQFPSRRSENFRAAFGRRTLQDGLVLIDDLLAMAARGEFIPTDDANDCRICEFAAVCRVRIDDFDNVKSRRVEWWENADNPAAHLLRNVRRS